MDDRQLANFHRRSAPDDASPAPQTRDDQPTDADDESGFDPFQFVGRCLRGRYPWAILLGVILAVAGGVGGWKFDRPLYKSEGQIRIAYSLPEVIRETYQNKPMAMFESRLHDEQIKLSSRTMVEAALERINGRQPSSAEVADLMDRLTVEHPAGTENLRVTVTDFSPLAASIPVNALINTYAATYQKNDQKTQAERLDALKQRREQVRDELSGIEQQADHIVVADSVLRQYVSQEADLERQLQRLKQGGFEEKSTLVQQTRASLEHVQEQIRQYSADMKIPPLPVGTEDDALDVVPGVAGADPFSQGDGSRQAQRQMVYLGKERLELERFQGQAAILRQEQAELDGRIEALQLESTIGSRLEIISPGEAPIEPFRDRRRHYAVAGIVTGALLPTVFLVLLGLTKPRYRFSDETEADLGGSGHLLGILPLLSERMNDPDRAAGAAQCVHQMRIMLQVGAAGHAVRYLVTSGCAGEGKTSLTLSLGLSFAAAGCRTLVIDADLVGRRLTHGFGADDEPGFFEAMSAPNLAPYVRQAAPGLWIMPSGRVGPLHAGRVPGAAAKALLAAAHAQFDVVLVDSGPILGSVEASVMAREVDGVIVAVARGQQPALLDKAIRHIRSMGAVPAGVIFNKAISRDFFRSSYGSSIRPISSHEMAVRVFSAESDGLLRFGPLVKAVMSSLPPAEPDELEMFHRQSAPILG